jgi:hypothetical protein
MAMRPPHIPHDINRGLFFGDVNGDAHSGVHGARPGKGRGRVPPVHFVRLRFFLLAVDHGDPQAEALGVGRRLLGGPRVASHDHGVAVVGNLYRAVVTLRLGRDSRLTHSWMYCNRKGLARRLSTGQSKNP